MRNSTGRDTGSITAATVGFQRSIRQVTVTSNLVEYTLILFKTFSKNRTSRFQGLHPTTITGQDIISKSKPQGENFLTLLSSAVSAVLTWHIFSMTAYIVCPHTLQLSGYYLDASAASRMSWSVQGGIQHRMLYILQNGTTSQNHRQVRRLRRGTNLLNLCISSRRAQGLTL